MLIQNKDLQKVFEIKFFGSTNRFKR